MRFLRRKKVKKKDVNLPTAGWIALIGFRGAGKSAVARELGKMTGLPVYELDRLVEKELGMSIPEIFRRQGWDTFRLSESRILYRTIWQPPGILDCGGGIVEAPENYTVLKKIKPVVWVDAEADELVRRLMQSEGRPLLEGNDPAEDVRWIYPRRQPLYRALATIRVDTSEITPRKAAELILEYRRKHEW